MKKNKISIAALIAAMLWGTMAIANEVYIEQVGNSSTINITQQGSDNKIGDNINSAYIGNGSNTVNVDQIGNDNKLSMVLNGTSTDVTVLTNGSGNTQEINCGTLQSSSCGGSTISQTVTGDNNTVIQNLNAGANHTSNITVLGDTNAVTHTSTNSATTLASINVTGNTNTIGVTQSGTLPQSVTVTSTGNNNIVSINQSN